MNKHYKIIKLIGLIFLLLILIFSLGFYFSITYNRKKSNEDFEKYSKICDTISVITEQPEIGFSHFNEKEIETLKFQLFRNSKKISDTVIKNNFTYVSDDKVLKELKIPFKKFLKSDTIVVTTANNLKFYISSFHYFANPRYGALGYVGSCDCRISEDCIVNKCFCNGTISKDISWLESEKNNRLDVVNPQTEKFDSISKKSKVSYEEAENIFYNNRKNKHWISQINCGIHIEKKGIYYIFEEEREDTKGQIDIIKINTETGEYKRFTNFPFY